MYETDQEQVGLHVPRVGPTWASGLGVLGAYMSDSETRALIKTPDRHHAVGGGWLAGWGFLTAVKKKLIHHFSHSFTGRGLPSSFLFITCLYIHPEKVLGGSTFHPTGDKVRLTSGRPGAGDKVGCTGSG